MWTVKQKENGKYSDIFSEDESLASPTRRRKLAIMLPF